MIYSLQDVTKSFSGRRAEVRALSDVTFAVGQGELLALLGQGVGELLIGEFRPDGKFYFIKRLIAGLNKFTRREIYDSIQDLKTKTCPFANLPERASEHQHAVTSEAMAECVWISIIVGRPRRR